MSLAACARGVVFVCPAMTLFTLPLSLTRPSLRPLLVRSVFRGGVGAAVDRLTCVLRPLYVDGIGGIGVLDPFGPFMCLGSIWCCDDVGMPSPSLGLL